jgi:hypothetical protein
MHTPACLPALPQAALKLEAAASYVEEALVRKAAVEAENAAAEARAAEEEAVVSEEMRDWHGMLLVM